MKRSSFVSMIFIILLLYSCNPRQESVKEKATAKDYELTEEEKAGGRMTPEIMWKFGRLGTFDLSPDGSEVLYSVTRTDLQSEARETNIFRIPSSGGDPVQVTEGGGNSPQWIDEGKRIAFLRESGLYTMNPDGTGEEHVSGISDFDAFRISPDGKRIFVTKRVKLDQTANEKYNLEKAKVRIINDLMYRHWNEWSDYSYSHILVGSFNGQSVTDLKDIMEGERFESPMAPYFDDMEIAWSPDGKFIAYTCKKLTGKEYSVSTNSDIYLYNISSGKEINITEGNPGYDRYPVFSPDGSKIAYQSMKRNGYESDLDRLFVYDINVGSRTWVSEGFEFDVENLTWADNQNIYFTCSHLGTAQIFKVHTPEKKIEMLTEGIHNMGPLKIKSGVLVSGIVSMSMAPELSRVEMNTGDITQISSINNFIYESIKMGAVEEKYTKTGDNKDLQMWIVYPPDFDKTKKYPALLFCNGGPQTPIDQFWSYRWNFQMMAAKGYIVIAPNRRGNSGFGQAWKEEISGDYGGLNIQDYLDATDAMAAEPFVDESRLGAVGASYGGYSVFYLAGVHGGRFKAFISHCGVFDFTSWYGTTDELWFPDKDIEGPYWNHPRSYNFSPNLRIEQWDTPILIITGANDFRIPYTQSMQAFQAAQLLNIPSRLLFFENEYHFVVKPQNAVIWQKEFFEWLDTYLK